MRLIKQFLTVLLIFNVLVLSGCVPERTDNKEVYEYWAHISYGWYEITNATGTYADLNGVREDCKAWISLDYKTNLYFHIENLQEETLYYFEGDYDSDPDNPHGKIWFDRYETRDEVIPCDIQGFDDYGGVENFFAYIGTIGEDENQMTIAVYLREEGLLWDDVKNIDTSVLDNRTSEDMLPESYASYEAETISKMNLEIMREYIEGDYNAQIKITDASGALAEYEIEDDAFPILVRSNAPYKINYWIELEDKKLVLFSDWDVSMNKVPLEMHIDSAGHNAIDTTYSADITVNIVNTSDNTSLVTAEGVIDDGDTHLNIIFEFTIDKSFPQNFIE